MEKIKWILNQMPKNEDKNLAVMAGKKVSPQLSTVLSNTISKA